MDVIAWCLLLLENKKNLKLTPFSWDRRLHRPAEFKNFFNSPEVFRSSYCIVFRVPNELGHFRLGITFKIRASGVLRNQIKRTAREAFRSQQNKLGSYDYNVVFTQHHKPSTNFVLQLKEDLPKSIQKWFPSNNV